MLNRLTLAGIIPVILPEYISAVIPALRSGGLTAAELDMNTPVALDALRAVAGLAPGFIVGAGNVKSGEQAACVLAAGAAYIAAERIDQEIIALCREKGVCVLPECSGAKDVETALSLGIKAVRLSVSAFSCPQEIVALAVQFPDVRFFPAGNIELSQLDEYLRIDQVAACVSGSVLPEESCKAADPARCAAAAKAAADAVHGYELRHIGINSGSSEKAMREAQAFAALLGWDVKDGPTSTYAGTAFEMMKDPKYGKHGHLAVAVNNIHRAKACLTERGYAFIEESAYFENGALRVIYLQDEIGGFAIHLLQK